MGGLNKKGGVLGMYLVIAVALILIITTLFVFVSFNGGFSDEGRKLTELINSHSFEKAYIEEVFYDSVETAKIEAGGDVEVFEEEFKEIVSERDLGLSAGREFFDKVTQGEFEVIDENGKKFIVINDLKIETAKHGGRIGSVLKLQREI